jgi:alpha-L-fucosidase
MPSGEWPQEMVDRLKYTGDWLRVNGEAIYSTRPRKVFREGKNVWFTSSKDCRYVYAISIGWPGETFTTQAVQAAKGSQIMMLGVNQPLVWRQDGSTLSVTIPPSVVNHKPCQQAFAFKIPVETT